MTARTIPADAWDYGTDTVDCPTCLYRMAVLRLQARPARHRVERVA